MNQSSNSIFENCLVKDKNNNLICRCSSKKANWYLQRNLAELVEKKPYTIKLDFVPKNNLNINKEYILYGKPNICVVCLSESNLTKHHIIPYRFIKHFDADIKKRSIVDIYPLCRECHNEYEKHSQAKNQVIADDLNIHVNGLPEEELKNIRRYSSAACALLYWKNSIPKKRVCELRTMIDECRENKHFEKMSLIEISNIRNWNHPDYECFNQKVVETMGVSKIVKEWRNHFNDTMSPKHMPKFWLNNNYWS